MRCVPIISHLVSHSKQTGKKLKAGVVTGRMSKSGLFERGPGLSHLPRTVHHNSVQSLDRVGRRVDMRDDSAEILFQILPREAIVRGSSMRRNSAL